MESDLQEAKKEDEKQGFIIKSVGAGAGEFLPPACELPEYFAFSPYFLQLLQVPSVFVLIFTRNERVLFHETAEI